LPHEPSAPDSVGPGARRWTVRTALSRAAGVARREGVRSLWFKALGETVYRRLLLVQASTGDLPEAAPGESSFSFSFLSPDEIDEQGIGPVSQEEAVRRLRQGDRCFCAFREGRPIALRWIAVGAASIEYLNCRLLLAPGVAYVYDAYTAPEARGGGVFGVTWYALARGLGAEGIHTTLGSALPENRPARRALGKLPYRIVGTFGYVKLGPWRRCFLRARTSAARIATA
jgi:hypothetical protein